jgi:hypothetical protein
MEIGRSRPRADAGLTISQTRGIRRIMLMVQGHRPAFRAVAAMTRSRRQEGCAMGGIVALEP